MNRPDLIEDIYSSSYNTQRKLYDKFGTKEEGTWHRWVFEQILRIDKCKILEIGTGSARLWRRNAEHIPKQWKIHLTDNSFKWIQRARVNLSDIDQDCKFLLVDAQSIPAKGNTFDAVLAVHMLNRLKDINCGLAEIKRILVADGRLYAATIGLKQFKEAHELIRTIDPNSRWPKLTFSLENGNSVLSSYFENVSLLTYEENLRVTKVAPLLHYFSTRNRIGSNRMDELRVHIKREIDEKGYFLLTQSLGMFEAY